MKSIESFLLSVCKMSAHFAAKVTIEASTCEEENEMQVFTHRNNLMLISFPFSETAEHIYSDDGQIEMLFEVSSTENDQLSQNQFYEISMLTKRYLVPNLDNADHVILAMKGVTTDFLHVQVSKIQKKCGFVILPINCGCNRSNRL